MKTVWSKEIDEIFKCGLPLNHIGVNNWALTKDAALGALSNFQELKIPILGGDVCELIDGIIQYNYDSWHCDRKQEESMAEFVLRSISKARQYIENYQSSDPDNVFFALVPEV